MRCFHAVSPDIIAIYGPSFCLSIEILYFIICQRRHYIRATCQVMHVMYLHFHSTRSLTVRLYPSLSLLCTLSSRSLLRSATIYPLVNITLTQSYIANVQMYSSSDIFNITRENFCVLFCVTSLTLTGSYIRYIFNQMTLQKALTCSIIRCINCEYRVCDLWASMTAREFSLLNVAINTIINK